MSKIRLYGATSGYVEFGVPDVAGDVAVTLPNEDIATETYADAAASAAVAGLASESYVDTQVATKAPLLFTENVQAGDYTLVLSDVAKVIAMTNAGDVTIPPNSSVAFPIGTVVNIIATTSEPTSVSAGVGVTMRHPDSPGSATLVEWAEVSLRKRATDEWVLSGQVA